MGSVWRTSKSGNTSASATPHSCGGTEAWKSSCFTSVLWNVTQPGVTTCVGWVPTPWTQVLLFLAAWSQIVSTFCLIWSVLLSCFSWDITHPAYQLLLIQHCWLGAYSGLLENEGIISLMSQFGIAHRTEINEVDTQFSQTVWVSTQKHLLLPQPQMLQPPNTGADLLFMSHSPAANCTDRRETMGQILIFT